MADILLSGAGRATTNGADLRKRRKTLHRVSTSPQPTTPIRRAMQAYRNIALLSGRVRDLVVREHVRGM